MTYSSEVLADSPRLYYRLGESSGTTMADSSGNGHDGTYDATVTLGVTGALAGDANTAVTFPGGSVNAEVPLGTTLSGIGATASIEGWFKTTNTGAGTIVARWGASVGLGQTIILDLQTSNVIRAYVRAGTTTRIASATITGLRDGNWHHAVGVYDGTDTRLYVDGTLRATTAGTGTLDTTGTEGFTVGSRGATQQFFTGSVDEAALYSTALSAARVLAHYDAGVTAPTTPTATLAGTLQAKTAAFTALVSAQTSLSCTLGAKAAAFTVATVLATSLVGTVQPKTAAFTIDVAATVSDVSLGGTLQAKAAAFGLLGGADAALAGSLRPKTAEFAVLGGASVALAGTLPQKTAALSLTGINSIVVAGSLRAKTGAFTMQSGRTVALAATLRRKTSVISIASNPVVRLVATLRTKTAALALDAQPTATFAGTLQPKLATFVAYVVTPVVPSPVVGAQSVVVARAFGPVTMQGSQAVYAISSAYTPRARQRILVDNVDWSYFRGAITPDVSFTLLEPLLYGPATLDLPQVSACFERPGHGDLAPLHPGALVEVQRVIDDEVVGTDWKGVIVAFDTSGRNLSVELGGEVSGRAALRDRQPVIFPRVNDLGHQIADAITDLGMPHYPHLGAVTGIESMTTGGVGHHEHIQNLCAKASTRAGRQWTVMPNESTGAYETHRKDDTTIHGTVFIDDAKTVANLRRDISEEPNRIFVTGVTPQGQRIRFGVYPGLIQGPTPDFPGHMELGDTGDGVRLLIGKLHAMGYLKLVDAEGGYDQDVYDAVVDLQIDAGLFDEGFVGTAVPGEVNLVTWNALYDLGTTGNSLEWAHIEPAAQRRKVRPWNRAGTGGIMGVNPDYDPNHLVRDRTIDMGVGFTRSQLREFARTVLHDSDNPNWVGDIVFHTGALIRGDGFEGMTVTEADVMDARELRPGMNLDLPQFDGGIFVHIAAIQVDASGIVTATVDTRFRDALEVWEVITRNKESRNDPGRTRNQKHRSSTIQDDAHGEWDEFAGKLGQDFALVPGWNVFEVVAAMEGQASHIHIELDNPAEFACAVFGKTITAERLNNLIPRPLTKHGETLWESKADELDERDILASFGTKAMPCGYSPGRKVLIEYDPETDEETNYTVNDPTGLFVDKGGFRYASANRTELTVAVWVEEANTIPLGRIIRAQMESTA